MQNDFAIQGMHCPACVDRLTKAFRAIPGVSAARVTLSPPRAQIEADHALPPEEVAEAARKAGAYTTAPVTTEFAAAPSAATAGSASAAPAPSLYPLGLIVAYITLTVLLVGLAREQWEWRIAMNDFMAGFFLVFSFFKLLDVRGFADAYMSYDILARRSRAWALAYPFVELALGVAYLLRWQPTITNWTTLVLMLVGSVGVLRAVLGRRHIRCACLGTALNLPMTTVTLVEDLGMAAMAGVMLLLGH